MLQLNNQAAAAEPSSCSITLSLWQFGEASNSKSRCSLKDFSTQIHWITRYSVQYAIHHRIMPVDSGSNRASPTHSGTVVQPSLLRIVFESLPLFHPHALTPCHSDYIKLHLWLAGTSTPNKRIALFETTFLPFCFPPAQNGLIQCFRWYCVLYLVGAVVVSPLSQNVHIWEFLVHFSFACNLVFIFSLCLNVFNFIVNNHAFSIVNQMPGHWIKVAFVSLYMLFQHILIALNNFPP